MTSLDLLTDRQREVLRLVSLGYANYKVANELDIRVGTVKKHIEHILERLEVRSRVGAARIYIAGTQLRDNSEWWNVVGDADHKLFSP
jgi:two-component system nitrate/nitrite response regulator NarL